MLQREFVIESVLSILAGKASNPLGVSRAPAHQYTARRVSSATGGGGCERGDPRAGVGHDGGRAPET